MKRNIKLIIWGLILIIGGLFGGQPVQAADAGYEVIPVRSKQQANQAVTYYDFKLMPGQQTAITVNIKSTSDKPITIATTVSKATTNINGVVEYKSFKQNKSSQLPFDIGQIVTTEQHQIKLQPGEVKPVTYQIKLPDQAFDGEVVGGLNFLKKADQTITSAGHGMGVKNEYAYTIALVLHGQHPITQNQLRLDQITTSQINNRNVISLPLNNSTAAFLNKVATQVTIYRKGQTQARYTQGNTNGQIAPNSIYALPVRIGDTKFKAGSYTAKVKVTSKEQHWQFTQDFTITGKQARHYNQKAVVKADDTWLSISLIVIGIGLVIILVGVILWRKQRKIKLLQAALAESKQDDSRN